VPWTFGDSGASCPVVSTFSNGVLHYSVVPSKPLRSDFLKHSTVGQLLELIAETAIMDRSDSEAALARSQSS
jgi:hypothetical protein